MVCKPTIVQAFESPVFFGKLFKNQETWKAWKSFLKALFGLDMDGEEYKIFTECTNRKLAPKDGVEEAYAIVGRRGGKSQISALIAVYMALFGDWQQHLSRGETAYIFSIATDKTQARICIDYIKGILELFPDVVEASLTNEVRLKNKITISVKTCNFRAGRGFSTACIILDELAFYRSEESANPAEDVINSLLPSLLPGGKLIGISTPYGKFGYLYQIFKENFGDEVSDILVWKAGTRIMNPIYRKSIINRLLKRDKVAYKSEYMAEFREDLESYLSEETLDQVIEKGRLMLPYQAGKRYYAFCDPSGGRHDSMTLAIAHQEGKKVVVDLIKEVKSKFDPKIVVANFSEIFKGYGISTAIGDRYAGEWVSSEFKNNGIRYIPSKLNKSEIFLEFAGIVSLGSVELLDDERMKNQFLALERKTRAGGNDSVEKSIGMHDDVANSVAGVSVCVFNHLTAYLTEKEMEARLPFKVKTAGRGRQQSLAQRIRSAEEEMDEYMRKSGCRIYEKRRYF